MFKKINDLFGSMRMVLPEQKTAILEHKSISGLVERPEVDEDELGEMCFRIYDSTQYDYAIDVKWFKVSKGNLGTIEAAWGVVKEIDNNRKRFKLVCDWEVHWINIEDLVSVTK
ncbi:YolD-like family protein [Brevibacillus centrosporus]|uniref:YolD-like family protein n=1 Tax=Brevibacillus centrosporus TaxID=54910 RepID=UPI002E21CCF1|nr:YolD-like family protein [Brevibacillus centrosporus]